MGDRMAERLSEMAAKGWYGIDIMMVDGKIIPVEINGRRNSSTPTLMLAKRLSAKCGKELLWSQVQMDASGGATFAQIKERLGDALFSQESMEGCIPFHIGSSRTTGKIDVAILSEDRERLESLITSLA